MTHQSTSTATTAPSTSGAISKQDFEQLGTEELLDYLGKIKIPMMEKIELAFRENGIDGVSLLATSQEELMQIGIPLGPAKRIVLFVAGLV